MKEDLSKPCSIINNNLTLTMEGSSIPRPAAMNSSNNNKNKKKNTGAFSFFKAALFKLRQRNNEKPPKEEADKKEVVGPKEKWKKFVGSMRPLHLQENQSPRASSTVDNLDYMFPPASPAHSYSTAASGGTMSQYASANNLQELDKHDENDEEEQQKEHDPDEVFDAIPADDMIDVKAEEFIAHFYKEMKMQLQLDSAHRHSRLKGKGKEKEKV